MVCVDTSLLILIANKVHRLARHTRQMIFANLTSNTSITYQLNNTKMFKSFLLALFICLLSVYTVLAGTNAEGELLYEKIHKMCTKYLFSFPL